MRFYDCSTAPSPRLVRIFMAEKGLDIPAQQVDLRSGEHLSEAFRAINPQCTVPVLETDEGVRLTSTAGCWRYLEEICPEPALLGTSAADKARIADKLWWIEHLGSTGMMEALRNTAKGMVDRAMPGPDNYAQIPELGARGRVRVERFLNRFEALLDGDYVAGDTFSAADIAAMVLVDFAAWLKLHLPDDATRAKAWYERVAARPSIAG